MTHTKMTDQLPEQMSPEKVLRIELEIILRERQEIKDTIASMKAVTYADQLELQRLKKKSLGLKDRIARIRNVLTPDIIA